MNIESINNKEQRSNYIKLILFLLVVAALFFSFCVGNAYCINNGDIIKGSNSNTVYFMNNGKKIGIPDVPTFDLLHFNWSNLQVFPDAQVAAIPEGTALSSLTDGKAISRGTEMEISIIEAGKRRPVPDPETLETLGKTFNDVIQLESVFFDRITVGTAYPSAKVTIVEGDLIRMTDDLTVYYVSAQLTASTQGEESMS